MLRIPFTKMQGAGNDFVVIDARDRAEDWPGLAPALCDRHFGVGADGVLLAERSTRAPVRMHMINPDGSEAEMCGNGLRCFAKWAVERGGVPLRDGALHVETGAGILAATVAGGDDGAPIERVRLSMGEPRLAPAEIPVLADGAGPVLDLHLDTGAERVQVTCVSMGNPHAVQFRDDRVDAVDLERLGPLIERHDRFPQRTNFEIVNVASRRRLEVRVWERGAGLTLACGSGAAAALVAARLRGLADESVTVALPGGELQLAWDGAGPVYLEGPAAYVFDGEWSRALK